MKQWTLCINTYNTLLSIYPNDDWMHIEIACSFDEADTIREMLANDHGVTIE